MELPSSLPSGAHPLLDGGHNPKKGMPLGEHRAVGYPRPVTHFAHGELLEVGGDHFRASSSRMRSPQQGTRNEGALQSEGQVCKGMEPEPRTWCWAKSSGLCVWSPRVLWDCGEEEGAEIMGGLGVRLSWLMLSAC